MTELTDALRELLEAYEARYPNAEAGMDAQTAWVMRQSRAREVARSLLASQAKQAVQPPEFQEVSWGVDSVMRPCKSMAISEHAFREWAKQPSNEADSLCPHCGSEEWDHVTAERGRERDVPFSRCNRCEREWGSSTDGSGVPPSDGLLKRGEVYRHKDGRKGVLISSHPHDGALLIFNEQGRDDDDILVFFACETGDLTDGVVVPVASPDLREAAKQFYNLTLADPEVIIRPPNAVKQEAITKAGQCLRIALTAGVSGTPLSGCDAAQQEGEKK